MSKELYLNLMDAVLDAYSPEQIRLYIDDVIKNSITEHGFPRLTANLGILIAHGRKTGSGFIYSWDSSVKYKLINTQISDESLCVEFACIDGNNVLFNEKYTFGDNGIEMSVEGNGELEIMLPVFHFDGREQTKTECGKNFINVKYKGHTCKYVSKSDLVNTGRIYENRNGEYSAFKLSGKNSIGLNIYIS